MAIQFAKDEKVIKSFNYAAVGYNKKKNKCDTFKNLIVTNKRVIHEAVRETRGNELILRQEMPVTDAKYVKTTIGKTSAPEFLVQAIIFAIVAVAAVALAFLDFAAKFQIVFWIAAVPFVILAIVKLAAYFASRSAVVSFSIFTDHTVTPVMSTAVEEGDYENAEEGKRKKGKREPTLEIRVNADVAREIADELGAAILDAIAHSEDACTEEMLEDIPAFAVTETEDVPVDAPLSQEETPTSGQAE